ncbi:MAG: nucleotide exchange factor GrpE [Pyrinomonadaceae bacterium]
MSESDDMERLRAQLGGFFTRELSASDRQHRKGMGELLLSFIEVRDSLERLLAATETAPESNPERVREWINSLRLIVRQVDIAFRARGVTPLACLHQRAEPGTHEVVGAVSQPGVEEETIVNEVMRGYEWDGEILRKPYVVVARHAERSEEE